MENKLIANLFPTIHLFGEDRNYVLVIRKHTKQRMSNGYQMYFSSLSSVFVELFEFQVRARLSNGLNKSVEEMIKTINSTRKEILDLMKPFEQLKPEVEGQHKLVQGGIRGVDTPDMSNVSSEDVTEDKTPTLRGPIPREDMPF
jgi:hypothetical protein